MNPFLSSHANALARLIKTRSIVQYVEPFSSVKIATMASAFGVTEKDMMHTVEELISDGSIKGRIDSIDRVSRESGSPGQSLLVDSRH